MSKRAIVTLLGLCVLGAACGGLPASPEIQQHIYPGTVPQSKVAAVIRTRYVAFEPAVVTIHAGQTVEWVLDDGQIPVNVVFPKLHINSPTATKGTWYYTFNKPGTYRYVSSIHSTMFGRVIVKP
jgi:plastocyanin